MLSLQEVSVAHFMEAFVPGENLPPTFKIPGPDIADFGNERGMLVPCPGCAFFDEVFKESGYAYLSAYSSDAYVDQIAPGFIDEDADDKWRPNIGVYSTLAPAKRAYEKAQERLTHRARNAGASEVLATTTDAEDGPIDSEVDDAPDEIDSAPDDGDPLPLVSRTAWAWAELLVEVKSDPNETSSPHGARSPVPLDDLERQLAQGQIMHYIREVFSRQHRIFVFIIAVCGPTARLCLFDRAGAVISALFDYVDDPAMLATFLYRFAKMSREQRGHDPTATLATDAEEAHFRTLWKTVSSDPDSAITRGLKKAATPGWPVHALDIFSHWSERNTFLDAEATKEPTHHRCLVGRPAYVGASMLGKGTRCFVAWSDAEQSVLFIKDSWRVMSEDAPSEFDNYQLLYRSIGTDAYKFYPTVRAGGDVVYQSVLNTGDPTLLEHPSQGGRYYATARSAPQDTSSHRYALHLAAPRRHSRLVLQQVCGTLENFKHPQELVFAMMVALMAHSLAWSEAKLLHCDVSPGNILIYDPPDGDTEYFLSDWDLARTVDQLQCRRRTQRRHPGTWQFLSGLLQRYPYKLYELADELEAFVHVLNWCALKYLRHSLSGKENSAFLSQTFHDVYDDWTLPGIYSTKFLNLCGGVLFVEGLDEAAVNPLSILLGKLAAMCKKHYDTVDFSQLEPRAVQPASTPGPRIASFGGAADRLALYNNRHGQGVSEATQPSPEPPTSVAVPVISPLSSHGAMVAAFCAPFSETEGGEVPMWPTDFVKVTDQVPVSTNIPSW